MKPIFVTKDKEQTKRDRNLLLRRSPWTKRSRFRFVGSQIRDLIRIAVITKKPKGFEIAGLIIDTGHCQSLILQTNASRTPGHFVFIPKQIRTTVKAAKRLGFSVIGTFHSHPASFAIPGSTDIKFAEEDDLMLVIDCFDREARLWRIRGNRAYFLQYQLIDS